MDAASTAEGIHLDETAVESMGIEWSSRLALSCAAPIRTGTVATGSAAHLGCCGFCRRPGRYRSRF
jgi:hypothetical protein